MDNRSRFSHLVAAVAFAGTLAPMSLAFAQEHAEAPADLTTVVEDGGDEVVAEETRTMKEAIKRTAELLKKAAESVRASDGANKEGFRRSIVAHRASFAAAQNRERGMAVALTLKARQEAVDVLGANGKAVDPIDTPAETRLADVEKNVDGEAIKTSMAEYLRAAGEEIQGVEDVLSADLLRPPKKG